MPLGRGSGGIADQRECVSIRESGMPQNMYTTVSADKFSIVANIAVPFSWQVDGDSRRFYD